MEGVGDLERGASRRLRPRRRWRSSRPRRVRPEITTFSGPLMVAIETSARMRRNRRSHALLARHDGDHPALLREGAHQSSPLGNEPQPVLQAEDAGHAGRHVLPRAVPDHEVGLDSPALPHLAHRPLEREQGRLGEGGVVDRRLDPGGGVDQLDDAAAHDRSEDLVAPVHGPAERGLGLVEPAPHLDVLRPLAGEEEAHARTARRRLARHQRRRAPFPRRTSGASGARSSADAPTTASRSRNERTPGGGAEARVRHVEVGILREVPGVVLGRSAQRFLVLRRQHQDVARALGVLARRAATTGASPITRWALVPLTPNELIAAYLGPSSPLPRRERVHHLDRTARPRGSPGWAARSGGSSGWPRAAVSGRP